MELPRRRMYGCEEEDAMTLFRAGAGAGRSMPSMYHHDIAAGEQADDDVLNLYGNGTAASSATEHHHICHEHRQARSSGRSHVDVATDDENDEIEKAVALRRRRQQRQRQVVADAAAATDAVLVARDNREVSRQNAVAAERNAEAAREHAEVAMASAAPRVAGGGVAADVAARRRRRRHDAEEPAPAAQRDNDAGAAAEAAARAHAEIAHLIAEGVAEVARLRAVVARRSDEAAAGIIMSFAAALFAPFLMAALLYYILPLTLK